MKFETLDYEVRDHVAEITMKRGPVNAINHQLIDELLAAYGQARDDDQVRAIILTSAFKNAFSAGMDLQMMLGKTGLDLHRFLEKLYFRMHDMQYRMGKPTIAALTGPAREAGITLAVSCDIIIASDTATLAYTAINVGIVPAMHIVHLPRQIGRHKAFEHLFTGRTFTPQEAERNGMINRVVPQARVMEEARELAREFATKSPVVMQLARDAFMRANDLDYRRSLENTVESISMIFNTEDAQEGFRAFNEKRQPKWATPE
ncbi:MAG: enoyl-CoA hydratase/isomerase family protein [Devosia sp.]|nr:enoyl-CoA hydratase/isomerase family protein [Devosia sp.]